MPTASLMTSTPVYKSNDGIIRCMKPPTLVEEWHDTVLKTDDQMQWAIQRTIEMIGPGYIPCLVCKEPTGSRGIYLPVDHREDLGNGEHFKNMSRIFSFALCDDCSVDSHRDGRLRVRECLKEAVKAALKENPETIQ